ncbi:unnamed protein product [marine sediment metagenome]|uniref:Uncharacterized protein n=1 Tax=marine sediment metagenome TaxID=412755 RepID=X1TTF5_9ZZZZ
MQESYFTVTATGNTYRVKHQLKSWGFRWDPHLRAWVNLKADTWRLNDYMKLISSSYWRGINLACEKRQDLQT